MRRGGLHFGMADAASAISYPQHKRADPEIRRGNRHENLKMTQGIRPTGWPQCYQAAA